MQQSSSNRPSVLNYTDSVLSYPYNVIEYFAAKIRKRMNFCGAQLAHLVCLKELLPVR
jgi:hypothetical protein